MITKIVKLSGINRLKILIGKLDFVISIIKEDGNASRLRPHVLKIARKSGAERLQALLLEARLQPAGLVPRGVLRRPPLRSSPPANRRSSERLGAAPPPHQLMLPGLLQRSHRSRPKLQFEKTANCFGLDLPVYR